MNPIFLGHPCALQLLQEEVTLWSTIDHSWPRSPFWWGVLKAANAFASGVHVEVENGRSTRFWLDQWVGDDTLDIKSPDLFMLALDSCATLDRQVCALNGDMTWAPQFRRWPHPDLSADLNTILTILQPIHLSTSLDTRKWKLKRNGSFFVNSLQESHRLPRN